MNDALLPAHPRTCKVGRGRLVFDSHTGKTCDGCADEAGADRERAGGKQLCSGCIVATATSPTDNIIVKSVVQQKNGSAKQHRQHTRSFPSSRLSVNPLR